MQVAALAPGPEAIGLLAGLAGREMTYQQQLQVIELFQPQLAWLEGAEQTALLEFAGPDPETAGQGGGAGGPVRPHRIWPRCWAARSNHAFDRVFTARKLARRVPRPR